MIDQSENIHYNQHYQQHGNFIDHLLDEAVVNKEIFSSNDFEIEKNQEQPDMQDREEIQSEPFRMANIEKEESNILLPEQPFQEICEDDQFLIKTPQKRQQLAQIYSPKKENKFDKTIYKEEKRADKIERYIKKKLRRIWCPKIAYGCRKIVADNRIRDKGRFVKKSPVCELLQNSYKSSIKGGDHQYLKESTAISNIEQFYL